MSRAGLVYLRPVQVAYFRYQGSYAKSSVDAWAAMFSWLDASGLRAAVGRGYGLQRDNPQEVGLGACRYDACVEVPDGLDPGLLDKVSMQKLPGGAYARTRHVGSYEDVSRVITSMRDGWMSSNQLMIDTRRPIVTIYLVDPKNADTKQLKADVCLPVTAVEATGRTAA